MVAQHPEIKPKGLFPMKPRQKVPFILILVIFVAVSVTTSLISISSAPYKFGEETAIGGDETLLFPAQCGKEAHAVTKGVERIGSDVKITFAQALPLKAAEQKDKRHLYFCRCLFSWRR